MLCCVRRSFFLCMNLREDSQRNNKKSFPLFCLRTLRYLTSQLLLCVPWRTSFVTHESDKFARVSACCHIIPSCCVHSLTRRPLFFFLLHLRSGRPHYRLYAIHRIPSLKCLDFSKIKRSERAQATRLANSAAGAALDSDINAVMMMQDSAYNTNDNTFTPGESADGATVVTLYTAAEKEDIRNLLANASSLQEVEEIENAVKRGVLPDQLRKGVQPAPAS